MAGDGGDDGVGARGGDFDPVREIQTASDEVGDGLLGVLGADGGEERIEAGDVAGGADGFDARVEGSEEGGHGAAAGAAEGSDAVGVDLGAGDEVVDGADAVPGEVAGDGVAYECGLEAGFTVLAGGARGEGGAGVRGVRVLEALALADGVVGEDGEAVAGERCLRIRSRWPCRRVGPWPGAMTIARSLPVYCGMIMAAL